MSRRSQRSPGQDSAPSPGRPRGRPRDPRLDAAILAVAERQLRERGYAGMSLEAVAAEAGTTVPSLRRRYRDKADLATAVVDSLRVDPLPVTDGPPRARALAILENFGSNLRRPHSMALLGTLLAEQDRTPQLLARFRARLSKPRRTALGDVLQAGIEQGQLPATLDVDAAVNMLIGSFYARYVSHGAISRDWPRTVLAQLWPEP